MSFLDQALDRVEVKGNLTLVERVRYKKECVFPPFNRLNTNSKCISCSYAPQPCSVILAATK